MADPALRAGAERSPPAVLVRTDTTRSTHTPTAVQWPTLQRTDPPRLLLLLLLAMPRTASERRAAARSARAAPLRSWTRSRPSRRSCAVRTTIEQVATGVVGERIVDVERRASVRVDGAAGGDHGAERWLAHHRVADGAGEAGQHAGDGGGGGR